MNQVSRNSGTRLLLALPMVLAGCGAPLSGAPSEMEPEFSTAQQKLAIDSAAQTARTAAACVANGNFYWEIGHRGGVIGSGSVVNNASAATVDANSYMSIASASKMVFAAYVSEYCGGLPCTTPGNPVPAETALRMLSGYVTSGSACSNASSTTTVAACTANPAVYYKAGADGVFHYSGGQFITFAQGEPHLQNLTGQGLANEVNAYLGTAFNFGANGANPWPAGAGWSTPANYAVFLRNILYSNVDPVNGLKFFNVLGADAVDASVAASSYTPVTQQNWAYSYGHWVEDQGSGGAAWDRAFSSPGAFGFYPWIAQGKRTYGIVARTGGNFFQSVLCGQAIRRAYFTNTVQP